MFKKPKSSEEINRTAIKIKKLIADIEKTYDGKIDVNGPTRKELWQDLGIVIQELYEYSDPFERRFFMIGLKKKLNDIIKKTS